MTGSLIERQNELQHCTLSLLRLRPDPATVRLDNRTADRQSHSHAFRLRCKECVEKPPGVLFADARAGIFYDHLCVPRIEAARADPQGPRPSRDARHRLHAVHHEVDDDLLQLHAVGTHLRRRTRVIGIHFDTVPIQFASHRFDGFSHYSVQIEYRLTRIALLRHRPYLADHIARALGVANHLVNRLSDFLQIDLRTVQPAQ